MSKKNLDVEINLLSFIGLLAVCICFLLLAAIWVHVSSLNVKQAIGASSSVSKKEATLWAYFSPSGKITLKVENVSRRARRKLPLKPISTVEGKPDFTQFAGRIATIKERLAKVDFGMAMVVPHPKTRYQDLIKLMDILSNQKFDQIGVVPI